MAELKVILKQRGNFKIYWESVSKLLCLLGAQNRSKLTERMKAADLPFLYPGYLLHQASPGSKPGISEHAPVMLFMPIYFVLGQHDVQSPSRHDSEVWPDFMHGGWYPPKCNFFEFWRLWYRWNRLSESFLMMYGSRGPGRVFYMENPY